MTRTLQLDELQVSVQFAMIYLYWHNYDRDDVFNESSKWKAFFILFVQCHHLFTFTQWKGMGFFDYQECQNSKLLTTFFLAFIQVETSVAFHKKHEEQIHVHVHANDGLLSRTSVNHVFRTPFFHEFLLLLNLFQLVLNLFAVRLFVFRFWQMFCKSVPLHVTTPKLVFASYLRSPTAFSMVWYCNLFQIFNVDMLFTEMDFVVRYYVCTFVLCTLCKSGQITSGLTKCNM